MPKKFKTKFNDDGTSCKNDITYLRRHPECGHLFYEDKPFEPVNPHYGPANNFTINTIKNGVTEPPVLPPDIRPPVDPKGVLRPSQNIWDGDILAQDAQYEPLQYISKKTNISEERLQGRVLTMIPKPEVMVKATIDSSQFDFDPETSNIDGQAFDDIQYDEPTTLELPSALEIDSGAGVGIGSGPRPEGEPPPSPPPSPTNERGSSSTDPLPEQETEIPSSVERIQQMPRDLVQLILESVDQPTSVVDLPDEVKEIIINNWGGTDEGIANDMRLTQARLRNRMEALDESSEGLIAPRARQRMLEAIEADRKLIRMIGRIQARKKLLRRLLAGKSLVPKERQDLLDTIFPTDEPPVEPPAEPPPPSPPASPPSSPKPSRRKYKKMKKGSFDAEDLDDRFAEMDEALNRRTRPRPTRSGILVALTPEEQAQVFDDVIKSFNLQEGDILNQNQVKQLMKTLKEKKLTKGEIKKLMEAKNFEYNLPAGESWINQLSRTFREMTSRNYQPMVDEIPLETITPDTALISDRIQGFGGIDPSSPLRRPRNTFEEREKIMAGKRQAYSDTILDRTRNFFARTVNQPEFTPNTIEMQSTTPRIGYESIPSVEQVAAQNTIGQENIRELQSFEIEAPMNLEPLERVTASSRGARAKGTSTTKTSLAGGVGGTITGIAAGVGTSEILGIDNEYVSSGVSGAVGGAVGSMTDQIIVMSVNRALTRTGAEVATSAATSSITGATTGLRSVAMGGLKGGVAGAGLGIALMPLDSYLNNVAFSDMSRQNAGIASSAIVGATGGAIMTGAMVGSAWATGAALAPETLGVSLAVAAIGTAIGATVAGIMGADQDKKIKKAKRQARDQRVSTNAITRERSALMGSLPQYNYNFQDALNAYPNKAGLGINNSSWAAFSNSANSTFSDNPQPLVPPTSAPTDPDQIKMNALYNRYVTHRLVSEICTAGTTCNIPDPTPLNPFEINYMNEKSNFTWQEQADMSVLITRQAMDYDRTRIAGAQTTLYNNWYENNLVADNLDPATVALAFRDPAFQETYYNAIELDAQQQVVDSFRDGKRIEELDQNVQDMANRNPEFDTEIHRYYDAMDNQAEQLNISVNDLFILQDLPEDQQDEAYQVMQFDSYKEQSEMVSEAQELAKQEDMARDHSFYDLDLAYLSSDPTAITSWMPSDSQIFQAHLAGMNLNQYYNYMHELSKGDKGNFKNLPDYTDDELRSAGIIDYLHFQDAIQVAGYNANLYLYDEKTRAFTLNPNVSHIPIPADQITYKSRYLPQEVHQARRDYREAVIGLNKENQAAVDAYNSNLRRELSTYGHDFDYSQEVADYNDQVMREGGGELLFFHSGEIYNKNRIQFNPINLDVKPKGKGPTYHEMLKMKEDTIEKYGITDKEYKEVEKQMQKDRVKYPTKDDIHKTIKEIRKQQAAKDSGLSKQQYNEVKQILRNDVGASDERIDQAFNMVKGRGPVIKEIRKQNAAKDAGLTKEEYNEVKNILRDDVEASDERIDQAFDTVKRQSSNAPSKAVGNSKAAPSKAAPSKAAPSAKSVSSAKTVSSKG